jgi:hypothetical protein
MRCGGCDGHQGQDGRARPDQGQRDAAQESRRRHRARHRALRAPSIRPGPLLRTGRRRRRTSPNSCWTRTAGRTRPHQRNCSGIATGHGGRDARWTGRSAAPRRPTMNDAGRVPLRSVHGPGHGRVEVHVVPLVGSLGGTPRWGTRGRRCRPWRISLREGMCWKVDQSPVWGRCTRCAGAASAGSLGSECGGCSCR